MAAEQTLRLLLSGFSFAVRQIQCLGIYYHSGIPAANRHVVETGYFPHWREMYLLYRASVAAHETASRDIGRQQRERHFSPSDRERVQISPAGTWLIFRPCNHLGNPVMLITTEALSNTSD